MLHRWIVLSLCWGCSGERDPCLPNGPVEQPDDVRRALRDFEAWSGEVGCVSPGFLPDPEDDVYLASFEEACRTFDARTDFTLALPTVFPREGEAWEDTFPTACRAVPSQQPWRNFASEQLCGRPVSLQDAVLRELFAGNALPLEPGVAQALGTLPALQTSGNSPMFGSSPDLLVGVALEDVGGGFSGSVRTVRAYALPSLQPLWTETVDELGVVIPSGGLTGVLLHDEDDQMWMATRTGLVPMQVPPGLLLSNVGFAEDDEGWWVLGWAGGTDTAMVLEPLSRTRPAYWSVRSAPEGVWFDDAGGVLVQERTGAAIEAPRWIFGNPTLTMRSGVAELRFGSLQLARQAGGSWSIEGADCGDGVDRRPVNGPQRLFVDVELVAGSIVRRVRKLEP